jgi:pimeloyl-ACP methyl ester carboxylesterase
VTVVNVVFVHGIRLSGTAWGPVRDRLGEGYRTAAPDLPGHGIRRGTPFTRDAAVATIAAAIDELGAPALLVGHSLGGYTSIATAAAHPERLAGLVAIGCSRRLVGVFAARYRAVSRVAAAFPGTANGLSAWTFRRLLPADVAAATVAGGLFCNVMPQVMVGIVGFDPIAALGGYPGPVWLVNGARDGFRGDERAFLGACRDGELTVLPGRGHITCLADPTVLADLAARAAAQV